MWRQSWLSPSSFYLSLLHCEDFFPGIPSALPCFSRTCRWNKVVIKEASAWYNGRKRTETQAIKSKDALIRAYAGIVAPPVNQEHLQVSRVDRHVCLVDRWRRNTCTCADKLLCQLSFPQQCAFSVDSRCLCCYVVLCPCLHVFPSWSILTN